MLATVCYTDLFPVGLRQLVQAGWMRRTNGDKYIATRRGKEALKQYKKYDKARWSLL